MRKIDEQDLSLPDSEGERRPASVTIVIPTRNEAGNVEELVRRLDLVLPVRQDELLFVDDSDDDTPERIHRASAATSRTVRVLHRVGPDRVGGLGGAVLAGLRHSSSDLVVVMDADLQHPPEMVPVLLEAARRESVDVVVASRHCLDGAADGLSSRVRALVSNSATTLSKATFPRRLSGTTDPMSGFFVVRREALDLEILRPLGFKILLEILARTPGLRVSERPFVFAERHSGASKANLLEGLRFVRQLVQLRASAGVHGRCGRAVAFGLVGASGIAVNTLAFMALLQFSGLHYLFAAVLATQASTLWNFCLAERIVFRGDKRGTWRSRLLANVAVNSGALVLRLPMLALLVDVLGVGHVLGNIATLLVLFLVRFVVLDELVYRPERSPMSLSNSPAASPRSQPVDVVVDLRSLIHPQGHAVATASPTRKRYLEHRYDIHGLVTIGSEVPLKELAYFSAPRTAGPYDIEVRAGTAGAGGRRRARVTQTVDGVRYEEHLGRRGANFEVTMGSTIHVSVGALLVASPHVLYTNVIEALLRFVLVSRGHMLLHSACLDLGHGGVMLSARTDTGKTGTILRLLREGHGRFLSDDMTIIDRTGRAYAFPKPLTISQHTLRAVEVGDLSKKEWRKLRLQSRLHSKEGRNIGQWLGELNVPIMAFNAVTQWLVPPPKYVVDRLVECDLTTTTQVHDLFIIERGPHALTDVDRDVAVDALIENTDDAYGFPPFRYFAPAIVIGEDGYDVLRLKERQILEDAMSNVRVRRLAADDFSWAQTIPALVVPEQRRPDVGLLDALDERVAGA